MSRRMNRKQFGKKMTIEEFNSLTTITAPAQKTEAAVASCWGNVKIENTTSFQDIAKVDETRKNTGTKPKRVDMRKAKKLDIEFKKKDGVVGLDDVAEMYPDQQSFESNSLMTNLGIVAVSMDYNGYRRYVEEKSKIREQELRSCTTFGEMAFLTFQVPEMIRNFALNQMLLNGVQIISELGEKSELLTSMFNTSKWSKIVNERNAFFMLRKNGKVIYADFRPLFYGRDEVQLVYEKNGEMDFSRCPLVIDVSLIAPEINRLLC